LIATQSQHREAIGIAVESGQQQHSRQRRSHGRDVATQLGGKIAGVDEPLGAAQVGLLLRIAVHALLLGRNHEHRIDFHGSQARVGDQHIFIGKTLDLELAERIAEEGEAHDVVAGTAGKRDLKASLAVRAGAARDVAGNRRGGDAHAGEGRAIGIGDTAADHIRLGVR